MHTDTESPHAATGRGVNLQRTSLGAFFITIGLLFLLAVVFGNQKTRAIPGDPGPWMLPVILGSLLLLGGVAQVVISLRTKTIPVTSPSPPAQFFRQLALLGGVVLFVVALQWLGFLVATPLFVFTLLWRTKIVWWKALIAAVVLTGIGYAAFAIGFKTPLPSGFWS